MTLELVQLSEINRSEMMALMSHPLVLRHMPLAVNGFDYDKFIEAKAKLWEEQGYGPWAFILDGKFIGWGGLQPEGRDTEIALVLHPDHWGKGKAIYKKILQYAFETLHLPSVVVLFPPSRSRIKGLFQLGFEEDGQLEIEGEIFLRFRKFNQ